MCCVRLWHTLWQVVRAGGMLGCDIWCDVLCVAYCLEAGDASCLAYI